MLSLPFFFYRVGVMEGLERDGKREEFFCYESVMAHWTVARQAVRVLF